MTSISSAILAALQPGGSRMQSKLQSAVSSSTISATDQTALSSAITDIFGQLQSGTTTAAAATATATSTTTASATPISMKDRVDSMIDGEVSGGKLTTDQADELKSLFAKASAHMHAHHAGGSSAATDLASTDNDSTDALGVSADGTTTSTMTAGGATGGTSLVDEAASTLESFVSRLKSATGSNALYGAAGVASGGISSLLIHAFA